MREPRGLAKGWTASAGMEDSSNAKQETSCVMRPLNANFEAGAEWLSLLRGAQKQMSAPPGARWKESGFIAPCDGISCVPAAISIACPPKEQTCHVGATNDSTVNRATKRRS